MMARISLGKYGPGDLIPTENQLAKEFGCARATVNRALTSLAKRGILDRRRRVGTRVAMDVDLPESGAQIPTAREMVERSGQRFNHKHIGESSAPPPSEVIDRLFCSSTDQIVATKAKFFADDRLFCLEQRWHDKSALPGLLQAMQSGVPGNEWIAANIATSHIEHYISAHTARSVDADGCLECAPETPVIVYETCIWADQSPVSYSRYVLQPGIAVPTKLY